MLRLSQAKAWFPVKEEFSKQQKMDKRHKADLHFPYCSTRLSKGFLWGG